MRPIDKSKRSNRKCEHCGNCKLHPSQSHYICLITGELKEYWRAGCANFAWDETKKYKPDSDHIREVAEMEDRE